MELDERLAHQKLARAHRRLTRATTDERLSRARLVYNARGPADAFWHVDPIEDVATRNGLTRDEFVRELIEQDDILNAPPIRVHLPSAHHRVRGATGHPKGRPHAGLMGELLAAAVRRDLYPIADLRACKGKADQRSRAMRDHLAVWLYTRDNVNRQALADLLGYDRKTVDRLYVKGRAMLELLEGINEKLDEVLDRLRGTSPSSEEIAAAVEQIIASAQAEAA